MGAKHFTELRAWQLANRLKIEIYRLTAVPPAVHDRRFCDDIRSAIASVCSNISEGFGRYTHGEFAQFVTIARGSLAETQNHLLDAEDRGYLKPDNRKRLTSVADEAMESLSGLLTYLRTQPTPSFRKPTTGKGSRTRK